MFAEQVLPRLRPIWDDEGWVNHWWPQAQGKGNARPTAGAASGAVPGGEA
jgi:hypothetical protein